MHTTLFNLQRRELSPELSLELSREEGQGQGQGTRGGFGAV